MPAAVLTNVVLIDFLISPSMLLPLYFTGDISVNTVFFSRSEIMSVMVISMLLCSRHNAAVLDELSCCPSVGVWCVYGRLAGWQAQMKDVFSSHLGTGGLTG